MRHLWAQGPSTVREVHTALRHGAAIRYTTVLSLCGRLLEKGFVERRRVMAEDDVSRAKQAYVYAARVSEAALVRGETPGPPFPGICHQAEHGASRAAIEQLLAYLGSLHALDGQPIDDRALDTITALLERAESAERAIFIYQAEALRAQHRAEAAEQRAAEGTAQTAPRPARAKPVPPAAVYDYPGRDKVCRVCGRPAPLPSGKRPDDLRVCSLASCRQEARRRDNVAKQRRCVARKRVQSGAADGDMVLPR
jgi:predicted transcriptional regulator